MHLNVEAQEDQALFSFLCLFPLTCLHPNPDMDKNTSNPFIIVLQTALRVFQIVNIFIGKFNSCFWVVFWITIAFLFENINFSRIKS